MHTPGYSTEDNFAVTWKYSLRASGTPLDEYEEHVASTSSRADGFMLHYHVKYAMENELQLLNVDSAMI